ncbi:dienelactone hydrolase family protein [Pseudoalteromonas sp. T1lg65]|uniref:dienelactone hydrolase family protein n=1 Tax=Pseudoalteromonas sp. T1lg65 TaxID=2077101 RepID=UPI003F7A11C6
MRLTNKGKVIATTLFGAAAAIGAIWYSIANIQPYEISSEQLHKTYQHGKVVSHFQLKEISPNHFEIKYKSFDGEWVNGQLVYPESYQIGSSSIPVMVGLHAKGRSDLRFFQESFKDRDTSEQTDELTKMALDKGYAVVAIDARNHGKRKDADYGIGEVMRDLRYFGKREPYEAMIINTVKDNRVLLDWIESQPQFAQDQISLAGYSMGGQISLLLAAVDSRVDKVLSIVPPHIGDATAIVAPKNVVSLINQQVWLVTADDDEYADVEQNAALFSHLASSNKKHIEVEGEHVLPEGYYTQLTGWY